jgi:hypothetical protein
MEALDPALFEDEAAEDEATEDEATEDEATEDEATEDDSVDGVTPSADWRDFSAPV